MLRRPNGLIPLLTLPRHDVDGTTSPDCRPKTPLAPPQLISSPMAVPLVVSGLSLHISAMLILWFGKRLLRKRIGHPK